VTDEICVPEPRVNRGLTVGMKTSVMRLVEAASCFA
jgi:hypothetical protein